MGLLSLPAEHPGTDYGNVMAFPVALPSCTVILCTRRRPDALSKCLASLKRLQYPDISILVIENDAVSGESEDISVSYGAEYRLCTLKGLSAARNFGVRISSSELLAFIDDDATCRPDWIVKAARQFSDPKVQAVTGSILFRKEHETSHTFDPGNRVVNRDTPDWFGMANFGGLGLGSNFLVRRSALDLLSGFDERLGRGAALHCSEENDLLFRIIDAGYSVATCSGAIVEHPESKPADAAETFRSVAASTVTMAMLAVEHPRHLLKLVRYLFGAIMRKPQSWRDRPTQLFGTMASRRTVYSALLAGPFLYLAATVRQAIHGTPTWEVVPERVEMVGPTQVAIEEPEHKRRVHIS